MEAADWGEWLRVVCVVRCECWTVYCLKGRGEGSEQVGFCTQWHRDCARVKASLVGTNSNAVPPHLYASFAGLCYQRIDDSKCTPDGAEHVSHSIRVSVDRLVSALFHFLRGGVQVGHSSKQRVCGRECGEDQVIKSRIIAISSGPPAMLLSHNVAESDLHCAAAHDDALRVEPENEAPAYEREISPAWNRWSVSPKQITHKRLECKRSFRTLWNR